MASRVAGKIKLQSVDELLGVPEIAGTPGNRRLEEFMRFRIIHLRYWMMKRWTLWLIVSGKMAY